MGEAKVFPIVVALETKNGTAKLVVSFSPLEQNFLLRVNNMPILLAPIAGDDLAQGKQS